MGSDGAVTSCSKIPSDVGDGHVRSFLFSRACDTTLEVSVKNRLRVLRAEREWSQADLAQRLKVSRQSVNAIETGKFDPSLPLAFKLARLFGTTIEEIFADEA
jgi:putative transcriptional regulator